MEDQGPDSAQEITDRLAGLENENELMRTLLASICSSFARMRTALQLEDAPMPDGTVLSAGVPADWLLEELKEEIDVSLDLLTERVALLCGLPQL